MTIDISGVLNDLAACLCTQNEDRGQPEPCFCGVIPGDAVIAEYAGECSAKNGIAWVRMGSAYKSTSPGIPDVRPGGFVSGLGLDIEIGILREQAAYLEADPIDEPTAAAALTQQLTDMETIRLAIECCSSLDTIDYVLGLYTPTGPLGGTVGGMWVLHVSLI